VCPRGLFDSHSIHSSLHSKCKQDRDSISLTFHCTCYYGQHTRNRLVASLTKRRHKPQVSHTSNAAHDSLSSIQEVLKVHVQHPSIVDPIVGEAVIVVILAVGDAVAIIVPIVGVAVAANVPAVGAAVAIIVPGVGVLVNVIVAAVGAAVAATVSAVDSTVSSKKLSSTSTSRESSIMLSTSASRA